mmetsp:Transcript_36241/g.121385  ORF Transcript_36241/g.121385 Transcript_36241/m.121385 type:complete len:204 (-) Transcript_36241:463-1074(-)
MAPDGRTRSLRRAHSTVRRIPCACAALCARCGRQRARSRCCPDLASLTLLPCCQAGDAPVRRPRRLKLRHAGHQRGGHHRVRRGEADALLLLCRRPRRRADEADEPVQHHRPGQPRQPGRVHDQAAGRARDQAHRLQLEDRAPPAPRRRPAAAEARHHQGARDPRLGTKDQVGRWAAKGSRILLLARPIPLPQADKAHRPPQH